MSACFTKDSNRRVKGVSEATVARCDATDVLRMMPSRNGSGEAGGEEERPEYGFSPQARVRAGSRVHRDRWGDGAPVPADDRRCGDAAVQLRAGDGRPVPVRVAVGLVPDDPRVARVYVWAGGD